MIQKDGGLFNIKGVRHMNLANELKQVCTVKNTKGGNYFATTYDCNLDFFASLSRYNKKEKIQNSFSCALAENKTLALANLLYTLDIKDGKGERKIMGVLLFLLVGFYLRNAKHKFQSIAQGILNRKGRYCI